MKALQEAVIDTNVLVYDTFEDSLHHEVAARLLDDLDRWLIPLIVLYEYVWLLKGMNLSVTDVRDKLLEYVVEEKCVVVREGVHELRWAISVIAEEGLSLARFNDKVILSIAVRHGVPLATFDARLRRQATKLGVHLIPAIEVA